jgi:hypothetical protein
LQWHIKDGSLRQALHISNYNEHDDDDDHDNNDDNNNNNNMITPLLIYGHQALGMGYFKPMRKGSNLNV